MSLSQYPASRGAGGPGCCGGRGTRTPKGLRPADFKSAALPVRTSPPKTKNDPPETRGLPDQYKNRKLVRHSPQITDLRLDKEEMIQVAKELASRLSNTEDKAYFMIPKGGFDSYAVEGGPFWAPEADQAFTDTLRQFLPDNIEVKELENDIEDPEFAEESVKRLIELIRERHTI